MSEIQDFDPDAVGLDNGNYFGMPFKVEDSTVVLVSVPWDVTVSYGAGTSSAPQAIIAASPQLDFYDETAPDSLKYGIATLPINQQIKQKSDRFRVLACEVIDALGEGKSEQSQKEKLDKINAESLSLNAELYQTASELYAQDKIVGFVGGDHSTPYANIKAAAKKYKKISVLHFDAHMDLRVAYEGFTHSHASIMYNVAQDCPEVEHFVQVGLRDFSRGELEYARVDKRFSQWTDIQINDALFSGESFNEIVGRMLEPLGENVYVSFDIDALEPGLCPGTGTPVPGGLKYQQAVKIISEIVKSKRVIVGFDVCEVAGAAEGEFDASVGARILFKLCMQAIKSSMKNDTQG